MTSVVGGLLGQLKPFGGRGLFASSKAKLGQTVLRGASKRAYAFEIYRREAAASLRDVGAVYCYARKLAAEEPLATGRGPAGAGFAIGYIGRTGNMARQDAEHDRLGHLVGHAFDALLILRIEEEAIRRDLEQDLIALYDPALNELLRGYQGAEVS
jgi:hypothetical protein